MSLFYDLSVIILTLLLPFLLLVSLAHLPFRKYRAKGYLWIIRRGWLVTLVAAVISLLTAGIFAGLVALNAQDNQQEIEEMQEKGWYPFC